MPLPDALISPVMRVANGLRTLGVRILRPVRLGARIVPVRADGQLLFVRHSYMPGWFFPGGAVDRGETTEAAALRELWEETGLRPTAAPTFVGIQFAEEAGVSDHVTVYAVPVTGTPQAQGWEISEICFAPADAPPEPLTASMQEQLALYRRSAR